MRKRKLKLVVFRCEVELFQAQIEVVLNNRKRQFTSALMRSDKQVYVYSRNMVHFN